MDDITLLEECMIKVEEIKEEVCDETESVDCGMLENGSEEIIDATENVIEKCRGNVSVKKEFSSLVSTEDGLHNSEEVSSMSWSPENVLLLIDLVKGHSSVYNCESVNYKNKIERKKVFTDIAKNIAVKRPGTTHDDVKKKWNILCSTYIAEKKKVDDSKNSGAGVNDIFKPALYYYEHIGFLNSYMKARDYTSSLEYEGTYSTNTLCNEDSDDNTEHVPGNYTVSPERELQLEDGSVSKHSELKSCSSNQRRKRKRDSNDDLTSALHTSTSALAELKKNDDLAAVYGNYLASRFRLLTESEKIDVQHEIENVFYNVLKRRNNLTSW